MKWLAAASLLCLAFAASAASVVGSKHDFSASGPGEHRASSETDACIFCHISHRAGDGALTNRPDPAANYQPYESTTMSARPGAPTGASRLCLSCHDGTIAVGQTRGGMIAMRDGARPIAAGKRANLGTDLRRMHPISMRAPPAGKTHGPPKGDAVRLDSGGLVQCTSCHDPHDEWRDPEVGKFMVKASSGTTLCGTCHTVGSGVTTPTHLSAPRTSKATAAAGKPQLGPAMARGTACGACHAPHAANARGQLMKDGVEEDDACLACHGSTTEKLVSADLAKAYAHRTESRGRHDAAEGPHEAEARRLPEASPAAPRHVTCVDCHDPHSSTAAPAIAPAAPGALAGVWGIDLDGRRVIARFEYEVCLKCHGDSANKPQVSGRSDARVRRASDDANLRLVFGRGAASSHPVAGPGRNPDVPSLLPPLSPTSVVYCTDCHASDAGPGAGGQGARGPHGSVYPFLLERQYLTDDFTPESPASYALCYKCHDREILLSDRSTFRSNGLASGALPAPGATPGAGAVALHRVHVVEQSAPCSACHDGHGVSRDAGNEVNNAHLVSFDLSIVRPAGGPPRYETAGAGRGSCNLTCHGVRHEPASGKGSY